VSEGGLAQSRIRTRTFCASPNHDKESFIFGVMAEASVLLLTCGT
jgi:hypothetical protein